MVKCDKLNFVKKKESSVLQTRCNESIFRLVKRTLN